MAHPVRTFPFSQSSDRAFFGLKNFLLWEQIKHTNGEWKQRKHNDMTSSLVSYWSWSNQPCVSWRHTLLLHPVSFLENGWANSSILTHIEGISAVSLSWPATANTWVMCHSVTPSRVWALNYRLCPVTRVRRKNIHSSVVINEFISPVRYSTAFIDLLTLLFT